MGGANGEKELLSVEDVAGYLGVRPTTVYQWCRDGRLPALKAGKAWRIRRAALDDFLARGEHRPTLAAQLRAFLTVPDFVLGVAEDVELLHRLDAAFFQVADAWDGWLVKFVAGEPERSVDELRAALMRHGLDVARLEAQGRFHFRPEIDPPGDAGGRAEALRRLVAEEADGRTVWATFDWTTDVDLEEALRQQAALAELVGGQRLVVKTGVLAAVADDWPPAAWRRARGLHGGLIELSRAELSLSRRAPLPPG